MSEPKSQDYLDDIEYIDEKDELLKFNMFTMLENKNNKEKNNLLKKRAMLQTLAKELDKRKQQNKIASKR